MGAAERLCWRNGLPGAGGGPPQLVWYVRYHLSLYSSAASLRTPSASATAAPAIAATAAAFTPFAPAATVTRVASEPTIQSIAALGRSGTGRARHMLALVSHGLCH